MTETDYDEFAGGPSGEEPEAPLARRRWAPVAAAVLVLVLVGLGLGLWLSRGNSTSTSSGPEGVPLQNVPDLAPADTTMVGAPIDGITCRTATDQSVRYHIHVLVDLYVMGQPERIPAGAGIAAPRFDEHLANGLFIDNSVNGCLYWLHVHSNDGVIHIESPYKHTFTLGQFFDIWQQSLGPDQVGPSKGSVVAFENGKRYKGNPRNIPLLPHAVIQLDVGQPVVAFQPVQFTVNGLCGGGTLSCAASAG